MNLVSRGLHSGGEGLVRGQEAGIHRGDDGEEGDWSGRVRAVRVTVRLQEGCCEAAPDIVHIEREHELDCASRENRRE